MEDSIILICLNVNPNHVIYVIFYYHGVGSWKSGHFMQICHCEPEERVGPVDNDSSRHYRITGFGCVS